MGDTRKPSAKEAAEQRKVDVIRWRREGVPFEEIGRRLNPEKPLTRQRAHTIYKEALKQIPALEVAEHRAEQLERLDALLVEANKVLARKHITVSHGQVVRLNGEPIEDDAPTLAAIVTVLKIEERRAKLLGLDAPVKAELGGNVQVRYEVVGVDLEALT